jgi:ATP synthase protein I
MVGLQSKAIRTVLRWQTLATAALAAVGGYVAGAHGALSAALGGLVSIAAGVAFAGMASMSRADSAGSVLIGVLIVLLLWLVMAVYRDVVAVAFFGTFIVATVLFSAAALVREE